MSGLPLIGRSGSYLSTVRRPKSGTVSGARTIDHRALDGPVARFAIGTVDGTKTYDRNAYDRTFNAARSGLIRVWRQDVKTSSGDMRWGGGSQGVGAQALSEIR
jgi:hypothetical protein